MPGQASQGGHETTSPRRNRGPETRDETTEAQRRLADNARLAPMAGDLPAAPGGLTRSMVLGLQGTIGNQVVARMLATGTTIQRKIVTIGTEKVEVDSTLGFVTAKGEAEKKEATAIIAALKATYGIDLSSPTVIAGIKQQYSKVPTKVTDALKTRHWQMIELRGLADALKHYAPILGAARAGSTRGGEAQEVTSVGKASQAIDTNTPAGQLDTDTLGEYFKGKKVMGLFKSHEGVTIDFPNEKDQLVSTFIHETAHGLLAYAYDDFVAETDGYWTDQNTKSGKVGAEAPITPYGATNAAEDLCETAKFYFVAPDRLKNGDGGVAGQPKNPAPKRHAFMEKIGKGWIPPLKDAPVVVPTPSDGASSASPSGLSDVSVASPAPTPTETPVTV